MVVRDTSLEIALSQEPREASEEAEVEVEAAHVIIVARPGKFFCLSDAFQVSITF